MIVEHKASQRYGVNNEVLFYNKELDNAEDNICANSPE